MPRFTRGLYPVIVWILLGSSVSAAEVQIQHHDLTVELNPATHELIAHDIMQLIGPFRETKAVRFLLNPVLEIDQVLVGTEVIKYWEEVLHQPSQDTNVEDGPPVRTIEIALPESMLDRELLELSVSYQGEIYGPPQAAPGLRFVRPDNTNGHVGEEGIYLSSETFWYPHMVGSLASFHVAATVPEGWLVVTHGQETHRDITAGRLVVEWEVQEKTEALSLVSNRFLEHHQSWKGIDIATYLFADDDHLAQQYIDATVRYLEVYTELLGPYPFPKFAVVENFFPSGLGMPSFTLLGQGVIKRGYTQPYSLGHEIVHSWIGNSVFNDVQRGNWVEGLTTYLANYYFEEQFEGPEKATAERTRMLYEYNLYASAQHDFPLVQFHHKETRADNAVGYQKAAMVFHMLRREIGDSAFFEGLRQVVQEFSQRYADWADLQHAFEQTSEKELAWFFHQWVNQAGAPIIHIVDSRVDGQESAGGGYWVRLKLQQEATSFRMQIMARLNLVGREPYDALLDIRNQTQTVSIWVPAKPVHLTLDPEFHLLRRMQRSHMPPMLNQWATDSSRQVVQPMTHSQDQPSPFQTIVDRVQSEPDSIAEIVQPSDLSNTTSMLVLGGLQENPLAARVLTWCGGDVQVDETGVSIQQERFAGEHIVVLVSCVNPHNPDHVGSVFWGYSPTAVQQVARLLFYYGWDSYLVFQQGRVVHRGAFLPVRNPLSIELQAA